MSTNPPSDPQPLQFDQVEYASSPGTAAGPAANACAACKRPLSDPYFEVNGKVVCANCKLAIQAQVSGGSGAGRFFRALVFGLLAAVAGSALYYGVRAISGMEIGLIAILAGWMVGSAVRRGSSMRGGLLYQILAALLTYVSISYSFLPDTIKAIRQKSGDETEQVISKTSRTYKHATIAATASDSPESSKSVAAEKSDAEESISTVPATAEQHASKRDSRKESKGGRLGNVPPVVRDIVLMTLMLIFALSLPIVVGASQPIVALIYVFGLWQAWRMNRRPHIVITGPYHLGASPDDSGVPPPLPS